MPNVMYTEVLHPSQVILRQERILHPRLQARQPFQYTPEHVTRHCTLFTALAESNSPPPNCTIQSQRHKPIHKPS